MELKEALAEIYKAAQEKFAHELIHHVQNLRGDLEMGDASSATYAQDDEHMRDMEKEAYLKGNLLFRDWEDFYKNYRLTNSPK